VKIKVEPDSTIRREGPNIISKHYVTLSDALLGFDITVNTVSGPEQIKLKSIQSSSYRYTLAGKGVDSQGDHIAEFEVIIPSNLDLEAKQLFEKFAQVEG
jgi:DnaJ-class molecular chaperone